MKIINKTLWRTDHLRAILADAAKRELEPAKRKRLIVEVVYARGGESAGSSGCVPFLGSRHATIRIRHPFSREGRYLHVGHDDPRKACGEWRDGDKNGKVVCDRTPHALSPEDLTNLRLAFASVAVHEFAHNRGMSHQQMPAYYKWSGSWRDYVAWADAYPLEPQAAPRKPTAEARLDAKLTHVISMEARATRRYKLAQTIVKKWTRRRRTLERRVAARKSPPADKS